MKYTAHQGEQSWQIETTEHSPNTYSIDVDGKTYEVELLAGSNGHLTLLVQNRVLCSHVSNLEHHAVAVSSARGNSVLELLDKRAQLARELLGADAASHAEDLIIRAVMPGIVRQVLVGAGEPVEVDAPVLILEAMKMENEVKAKAAGTVERILVVEGETVESGQPLLELSTP